jgi:hypothetical protein
MRTRHKARLVQSPRSVCEVARSGVAEQGADLGAIGLDAAVAHAHRLLDAAADKAAASDMVQSADRGSFTRTAG